MYIAIKHSLDRQLINDEERICCVKSIMVVISSARYSYGHIFKGGNCQKICENTKEMQVTMHILPKAPKEGDTNNK